jgi:hypothetical protein
MVLSPRVISNKNTMMAQKLGPENTEMRLVNDTKATPGPFIICEGKKEW